MPILIPSYVRSRRKRWRLSQRELAFLVGLSSQCIVSQHESLARTPQTKILLKYEIVFGEPMGALFPKLRADAEEEVTARAKRLIRELGKIPGPPAARKLELLQQLVQRLTRRS